jgi:hypothetical protein
MHEEREQLRRKIEELKTKLEEQTLQKNDADVKF